MNCGGETNLFLKPKKMLWFSNYGVFYRHVVHVDIFKLIEAYFISSVNDIFSQMKTILII